MSGPAISHDEARRCADAYIAKLAETESQVCGARMVGIDYQNGVMTFEVYPIEPVRRVEIVSGVNDAYLDDILRSTDADK